MTPVIGVTTVTGIIDKSGPLINWAVNKMCLPYIRKNLKPNKKYDELAIENILKDAGRQHHIKKEEAATAGTLVHEWAERWIKDFHKPKRPQNLQLRNGASAFLKWVKEHDVKFLHSEKKIYSRKYKYAGTADAIGYIGGKLSLIDFKTSGAIWDEYRLQVAGYLFADKEEREYSGVKETDYDAAWIARFDKDTGEFEARYIPFSEVKQDFQGFLGALAVKKRLLELKREK